jgi:hypothetical protein
MLRLASYAMPGWDLRRASEFFRQLVELFEGHAEIGPP